MANLRPRFPHLPELTSLYKDDLIIVRRADTGFDREIRFEDLVRRICTACASGLYTDSFGPGERGEIPSHPDPTSPPANPTLDDEELAILLGPCGFNFIGQGWELSEDEQYLFKTLDEDTLLFIPDSCFDLIDMDILLIAGGGGGGQGISVESGGGGGAGGVLETGFSIPTGVTIPVTVGAGGAVDTNGEDTTIWLDAFGNVLDPEVDSPYEVLNAVGGGRGGISGNGASGGSGGGGAGTLPSTPTAGGAGESSPSTQGYAGGGGTGTLETLGDQGRSTAGGGGGSYAGIGTTGNADKQPCDMGIPNGSGGVVENDYNGAGRPGSLLSSWGVRTGDGGYGAFYHQNFEDILNEEIPAYEPCSPDGGATQYIISATYGNGKRGSGYGAGGGGGVNGSGATAGVKGVIVLRIPVANLLPPDPPSEVEDEGVTFYVFTNNGAIEFPVATACDVICVGGGGAGGAITGGGGGGAGEVVLIEDVDLEGVFVATVGAGGEMQGSAHTEHLNGGKRTRLSNGDDVNIIAEGGGGGAGGSGTSTAGDHPGHPGGSGGGGRGNTPGGLGGSSTADQGIGGVGGNGSRSGSTSFKGGGGGGAGGGGFSGTNSPSAGGAGGQGVEYTQFAGVGGDPAGWFGGGGGGAGGTTEGAGGQGGGGNGGSTSSSNPSTPGVDGTGGGGGGKGNDASTSGDGGKGIIIIRVRP